MNLKKIIYQLTLTFIMIMLTNCSGSLAPDPSGSVQDDLYKITTNGNQSSLSQNSIDAEYNTFLFLSNENNRKIYLGGKIPGSSSSANVVWLINNTFWGNNRQVESIQSLNNYTYYSAEIIPTNVPSIASSNNEYVINTQLGIETISQTGTTYTPMGVAKNITFKIADITARNWNLDIYQQFSYNHFNLAMNVIEDEFDKMNVSFNQLNEKNSILTDQDVEWNFKEYSSPENNMMLWYAYLQVDPTHPTNVAIANYAINYPNNGLIFYIKNYHIVSSYPDPNYQGITFASGDVNYRLPVVSFICVGRMRNDWSNDWEDKVITSVSIHELGHLWCEQITDQTTHNLWHNGHNFNKCVMINPYVRDQYGIPDQATKDILDFHSFCEGHLQRGMNVSWQLKQYYPFGQTPSAVEKSNSLYASIDNIKNNFSNDALRINITTPKTDFIKGELIDVLVDVKNNTSDTLEIINLKHYLHPIGTSESINGQFRDDRSIKISPNENYKLILNPLALINYKDDDKTVLPSLPWYYWPEGDYEYNLSYNLNGKEYISNKLLISVKSVPDTLLLAFNDLKEDLKNPATFDSDHYKFEKYEKLFEKYKNSFYAKEFFTKLILNWNYYDALYGKEKASILRVRAVDLVREFIIKYPNTETSQNLFMYLMNNYDQNRQIIEEIITSLKDTKENSYLLQIIVNRTKCNYTILQNFFN
jgi:hypothetical protein